MMLPTFSESLMGVAMKSFLGCYASTSPSVFPLAFPKLQGWIHPCPFVSKLTEIMAVIFLGIKHGQTDITGLCSGNSGLSWCVFRIFMLTDTSRLPETSLDQARSSYWGQSGPAPPPPPQWFPKVAFFLSSCVS